MFLLTTIFGGVSAFASSPDEKEIVLFEAEPITDVEVLLERAKSGISIPLVRLQHSLISPLYQFSQLKLALKITSISLVGCTNDQATDTDQKSATGSNQESTVMDQEKDSTLRQENDELKQKVNELETALQYHDKAKELLNESFKLISAMSNKHFNYLNSVAGPKVRISENSDKIGTDEYGEVNFLSIPMNELQYRGFVEQGLEDKFQIALARVSEKGNVEIYS